MMTDPRILYIAGYSRSGSTMLDLALGTHPRCVSAGELTFLLDDAVNPDRRCTCGRPYVDCPVYGPWLASADGQAALADRALLRHVERYSGLDALMQGLTPPHIARAYRRHMRSLTSEIARQTGAEVIVDSSKSARAATGRPLALAAMTQRDVRIVHLTRDPRSVVGSYCETGSNWVREGHRRARPFDSFRPILGWRRANRDALRLGALFGHDRYVHIRYEDLVTQPESALAEIGRIAGLDLSGLAELMRRGARFESGHMVGGNRARHTPQAIALGHRPRPALPMAHAAALWLSGGGPARRLGYGGRPG
jgi:hypothetical protein